MATPGAASDGFTGSSHKEISPHFHSADWREWDRELRRENAEKLKHRVLNAYDAHSRRSPEEEHHDDAEEETSEEEGTGLHLMKLSMIDDHQGARRGFNRCGKCTIKDGWFKAVLIKTCAGEVKKRRKFHCTWANFITLLRMLSEGTHRAYWAAERFAKERGWLRRHEFIIMAFGMLAHEARLRNHPDRRKFARKRDALLAGKNLVPEQDSIRWSDRLDYAEERTFD
ncbi:unnamed protein product [Parajaminaea phylloscopi]